MRSYPLLLAVFLTGCSALPVPAVPYGELAVVSRVVDGDTVEAVQPNGTLLKLRILGIDTPETKHPNKPVECFGLEATEFARTTLLNRQVTLQRDPGQDVRDRYDRLLVYVVLTDGRDYSVLAAEAGVARSYVYERPVSKHAEIVAAEQAAQTARRGLWGACMF